MNPVDDTVGSERHLREGLAFFGAITASVTHELNNVLGTVDQITGLLEDLAYALSQGGQVTSDRLNEIIKRVSRQTERGAALVKRLNKFAHSADLGVAEFNLNDALQNIVALMNRLANMQKTELALTLPEKEITVRADRFMIIQIVFHIVNKMISIADRGTVLKIIVSDRGDGISVGIDASGEGTVGRSPEMDYIHSLAGMLSGQIEETIDDKHVRVEFRFPAGGA